MKMKLSLSGKLFLNNVFYSIPILVLLFLMFQSYNKDIDFAEKEMKGNDIQLSSVNALALVSSSEKYTDEIENKLNEVKSKHKQYESTLQLDLESLKQRKREHLELSLVEKTFSDLKNNYSTDNTIKDLRDLITHTGDTSNLILDPDLDSYYVMDSTLVAVPQLYGRLVDLKNLVKELKKSGQVTEENKIKLNVMLAMLKESDWGRSLASTQTAINEDKNFYELNPTLQNDVKKSYEDLDLKYNNFFKNIENIANSKNLDFDKYLKEIADIQMETFSFYKVSIKSLDELLTKRVVEIKSVRNKAMLSGIFSVLLALVISVLVSINFKQGSFKIANAIKNLLDVVRSNHEISTELTDSSTRLSSASNQQAAAVQETTSSLYEINEMSNINADNIEKSFNKTQSGKAQAHEGLKSIEEMTRAFDDISVENKKFIEEVKSKNEELTQILNIINDISDKTKVINDIVFQTKLLSFNASVEAARAGEHGKGFAVVAEEVGKLAVMSGESAKEINEILHHAIDKINTIVQTSNTTLDGLISRVNSRVENGVVISHQCKSKFEDLVDTVDTLNTMMGEISNAVKEQTKGYDEITKAMQEIDGGIHDGMLLAEKTSKYANNLNSRVYELNQIATTIESEVLGIEKRS